VQFFGGQQSSRTVHFFGAVILVLFLLVHVVMVYRNGFRVRMRTMIFGSGVAKEIAR
jgi:thiosulfate reductase cytochrome b subunit